MIAPSPKNARAGLALALLALLSVPGGQVANGSSQAQHAATLSPASQLIDEGSGIPLVSGVSQPHPKSESEAQAVSDAQVFAETYPDDVGYPWLDRDTGSLELSAASPKGKDLVRSELFDLTAAAKTDSAGKTETIEIRDVQVSMAELAKIADDVFTLRVKGVQDADLVYATVPDYERNRIVIEVSASSAALFKGLVARYGTEAVAVWVNPGGQGWSTASRQQDLSPFWGGARIGTPGLGCTDAFSWSIGTTYGNALLTAAHCIPIGGNVTMGSLSTVVGTVASGTEENWNTGSGTQVYVGQTTYRGDVALIRLKSAFTSNPQIYRGAANSSTHSSVLSVLRRYSYQNESVLVGGATAGETGPYSISSVGVNVWYSADGPNVIARNVVVASLIFPLDPSAQHGDSGGSVFRVDSAGNVTVVGTLSGISGGGGIMFTDIYNTYLALPGDINL